jgi:hypothetical protein
MKPSREKLPALALLLAVLIVNAAALRPELSISRVDLNDNVLHYTLVERMVQAVEHGENPLDCWSSEWSLGYPVLRTYQPLAHALVVLVYFALGKSVSLMTVFVYARFFSVVLLPLSAFAAARMMGLRPITAAAAAILTPLISTNFLYGMEYGSFTWAGSGLFPQAVGCHFLLITLGLAFRSIRRGSHLALTGALLGLTFLAHLIYGYMGALSVCLLAVIPDAEVARAVRIRRTAIVGSVALLLSAFQLAPLVVDRINHSRWEPVWKWDSFGAGDVAKWLVTGDLLDYGRFPVLTLLALAGTLLFVWNWRKRRPVYAAHAFVLWGAVFWTLLFFGRTFWGPLLVILGVSADMQLHRVIGGAQIFLLLLAAIALSALWLYLSQRWHYLVAVLATALLLYPMVQERAANLANDSTWGARSLAAHAEEAQSLDAAIAAVKERGGRAYSGLAASWGGRFKVGDVTVYAFLSRANVPAVAFLYHSMALTADLMVRFNEQDPSHYRLFNIHSVVAPVGGDPVLPPFLIPRVQFGRFRIFDAPGNSYFDLVDVVASVKTTRNNFYDINDRWLQSDRVMKRLHLWLDWTGDVPSKLARFAPEDALPQFPILPSCGAVRDERRDGEVYQAGFETVRPCFALFKMTWHANWKAYVDGTPQKTAMLTPGFVGVPLLPGRHTVVMRYEPGSWKAIAGFGGLAGVLLLIMLEQRGRLDPAKAWHPAWRIPAAARRRLLIAAGLILLALPVCIPLFSGSVIWGHDGFVYFPRLVELHQNITHAIAIPRWAPDLGRGAGQPLFVFHPPMIYYFGEFWHLLGFDFVTAMNLACVAIVLLSAVSMFLLASLYFGDAGGLLGAAAYLYVPYFAVDLYVRSAMEEFATFPFFALALYGFAAYARDRKSKFWLLGAAAFACVLVCHFPAALLFSPLLLAFLGLTAWMEKSRHLLWKQACGFLLGLGLSAFVWAPALIARRDVAMSRALEGHGRYFDHFVYLHQIFYSPWGYGTSMPGPDDGMSFALGWSHLLLVVVAWIWTSRKPGPGVRPGVRQIDRRFMRFFAIAGALLCVLMLENALWLWQHITLLQNVLFPWRLLGPVAVCTAVLIAPLGPLLWGLRRWRAAGIAATMAFLIVPNLSHLHPRQLADVDLAFWSPEQLAVRGFETTTGGEVTPRWMTGLPLYTPVAATVLSGEAVIRQLDRTPFTWSSPVNAKVASTIEMNTAWFPGWEVRVDGQPVPAGPGTPGGLITFQVPAGEHAVDAHYGRTSVEHAAAGSSILSLLIALLIARYGASHQEVTLP